LGDEVRVDVTELRHGAHQVGTWQTDLTDAFDQGHTTIAGASGGWVGRSSAALAEKLESLQQSAATLTGRMGSHVADFHGSANEYESQETRTCAAIVKAGRLDGPTLLNLDT